MVVCKDCKQEMLDPNAKSCSAHLVVINGIEYRRNIHHFDKNERCHDCGIENKPGNVHHFGCDVERCPECGGQMFICGCPKKIVRNSKKIAKATNPNYKHSCPKCNSTNLGKVDGSGKLYCKDCKYKGKMNPPRNKLTENIPMWKLDCPDCGYTKSWKVEELDETTVVYHRQDGDKEVTRPNKGITAYFVIKDKVDDHKKTSGCTNTTAELVYVPKTRKLYLLYRHKTNKDYMIFVKNYKGESIKPDTHKYEVLIRTEKRKDLDRRDYITGLDGVKELLAEYRYSGEVWR